MLLARELAMASNRGAPLNEIGDVGSDIALCAPLAWLNAPSRLAVLAFVVGAVFTEFSGVLSKSLDASRRCEGPMGKSDRAFWIGALTWIAFFAPRSIAAWPWIFRRARNPCGDHGGQPTRPRPWRDASGLLSFLARILSQALLEVQRMIERYPALCDLRPDYPLTQSG